MVDNLLSDASIKSSRRPEYKLKVRGQEIVEVYLTGHQVLYVKCSYDYLHREGVYIFRSE